MERIEIIKLPTGYAKGYGLNNSLDKELCEVGRIKEVSAAELVAEMSKEKGIKKKGF